MPREADLLEGDRVQAQEGGGITFRIMLVQRETVILGDLAARRVFAAGRELGDPDSYCSI